MRRCRVNRVAFREPWRLGAARPQILFDIAQHRFEQRFTRIVVAAHEHAADEGMGAVDRQCDRPVIRIDEAEQRTAGNELVAVDDLTVVARVHLGQLVVGPAKESVRFARGQAA